MRLTLHSDYGLRALVYLAEHDGRVVPTGEIGLAYGISKNHLVRVAHSLREAGFVHIAPGRSGGLSLARPPSAIKVGEVVRALEPDFRLVECFGAARPRCPIAPVCALARAVDGALEAFLASLDRLTVADAVARSGPRLRNHFLPVNALVANRRPSPAPKAAPPRRRSSPVARRPAKNTH